jgi:hypothetical protein
MFIGLHVQYPLFSSTFNENIILSTDFRKSAQLSNFKKICRLEAKSFFAGGRTDRRIDVTKLIVAFRNFANARCKHKICNVLQRNVVARSHEHCIGNNNAFCVCCG